MSTCDAQSGQHTVAPQSVLPALRRATLREAGQVPSPGAHSCRASSRRRQAWKPADRCRPDC